MTDPEQHLLSVRNRVDSEDIRWFKRGLESRAGAENADGPSDPVDGGTQ